MATHSNNHASSSVCESISYKDYDVFINHRGPDVKKNFASHLYRRIISHGLRVFLDKPELEVGQNIVPQILHAIETAYIHIAIFSSTYAESKWCLDELLHMLKSFKAKPNRVTIIPVFYGVKPSDLRWTTKGAYAKALCNHQEKQRYDFQTIQNWIGALSDVAQISGLELDAFHGDEGQLLDEITRRVLIIDAKSQPKYVAEHPTGLGEKLKEFENKVLLQQKGQVVGIVGPGGVGKTTLAKEFFNQKRSVYNRSSFLCDVRENAEKGSLNSLQRKLLKDLTQLDLQINSISEGIDELIKRRFSSSVLIILDDVDHALQLEAFLPIKKVLSFNSLILVTSRDKKVLKAANMSDTSIYNLVGLNSQHSMELFCSHAFYQPYPLPEFADLVDPFITACDGLSLSLKVFGALVCGENDRRYWEEQLDRLRQALPNQIQQCLRISYDSLGKEDQPIFLDIACFFIGEDRDTAIRLWGIVGLQNLENKCLLEVDRENKIKMHDHIRDMARNIAKEGSLPRRLYQTNNIDDLLEQSFPVITEVRGIKMVNAPTYQNLSLYGYLLYVENRRSEMVCYERLFNNFHCRGMRNLQLVATVHDCLESILKGVQSTHLIWLRWFNCPHSSLPSWIPMKNLRVLEVVGNSLNILWPHEFEYEGPLQLRELNIYAPLSDLPKSIGQLKRLEKIFIKAAVFQSLPEEFCDLVSMKYLELRGCERMKSLPDSFGKLSNLQHIDLQRALCLKKLPNSFGNLTRLKHLSLKSCSNLTISNGILGNITTLEYLDLSGCMSVKELPAQVAHQRLLQTLVLRGMRLKELPSNIGDLRNLEILELGSDLLQVLPPSIGKLQSLKNLDLCSCWWLKCLPDTFGLLTQLTELRGRRERETLLLKGGIVPNNQKCMFGLKELWLEGTKITEVDFPEGVCPNLIILDVSKCKALKRIQGFAQLTKLQKLGVHLCHQIEELSGVEQLISLTELVVSNCSKLETIKELGKLRELQNINIGGGEELKSIQKLRELHVLWCHELQEVPGLERLMWLEELHISDCPKLKWENGVLQQLRQRLGERLQMWDTE